MRAVSGLASLETTAILTMGLVFGVVAAILGLILWYSGASGLSGLVLALAFSFVLLGLQWYFGPSLVKWMTHAREAKPGEYPEIQDMIYRLSKAAGIPTPKFYVVENPSPNAFAFGRTQRSSNIAVHTGLLSALNKDEIESVLAHEVGHIKHRDVIVMTVASALPVMLYYIVLVLGSGGRDRDRGAGSAMAVWFGAMAAQFLGSLLVLWLSRKREYYADAFSAYVTGKPVNLMSGLAKITYKVNPQAMPQSNAIRAFYIADPSVAERQHIAEIARALDSKSEVQLEEAIAREKSRGGMELLMTHPLTAKRLDALLKIKKEIGA